MRNGELNTIRGMDLIAPIRKLDGQNGTKIKVEGLKE